MLSEQFDPRRDATNLDYRVLTLLFICSVRADLLKSYLAGPPERDKLLDLGFTAAILDESLYLFQDQETEQALKQTQRVAQTLINLNDYCEARCPSDRIVRQLVGFSMLLNQPLQPAGVQG